MSAGVRILTGAPWAMESARLARDGLLAVVMAEKISVYTEQSIPLAWPPDTLAFFVGWHRVEPPEVINAAPCFCVHPSALPQYRGGSPLQHQIMSGVEDSAVTTFRMTSELDAGPIARTSGLSLKGSLAEIFERMSKIAADHIVSISQEWLDTGVVATYPQYGEPTLFYRRTPDMSEITLREWHSGEAEPLANKIRALNGEGYPPAFIRTIDGRRLVIREAEACD